MDYKELMEKRDKHETNIIKLEEDYSREKERSC